MATYKRKHPACKKKFNKKLYRKTVAKKRTVKMVQQIVMKPMETKYITASWSKAELFHNIFSNSPYMGLNTPLVMPSQNVTQTSRTGDRIQSLGYSLKLLIGQKADRPNVTFRYLCYSVPKGISITYNSIFEEVTHNILLDDINKDIVTVHMDDCWRPNQAGLNATGNDEFTFVKKLFIPYKRLYKFGPADSANTHNQKDLYFCVLFYDVFGSMDTDNIAYFQTNTKFMFKDI